MVDFLFLVGAFSAGLAVVLTTRPDLVLLVTLGWSTMAGACCIVSKLDGQWDHSPHTTVEALRGLAVFALGLPAVFLVVVAFLVVVFAAGFSAFLAVAFLGAAALVVVFFSYRRQ